MDGYKSIQKLSTQTSYAIQQAPEIISLRAHADTKYEAQC